MTILEMSMGGGVLIAVILLLRRALLYRLPKWTFLLLWAAALFRLLVPFTVPSPCSVYTGAAWAVQAVQGAEAVSDPVSPVPPLSVPGIFREGGAGTAAPAQPEREQVSPAAIIHLTGAFLSALFFFSVYRRSLRRFRGAVPADQAFIARWQEEHPTLFPVQVKTCGAVAAPVAYGLLRPVVLLPETVSLQDEDQLIYILTHEYVHIRRGDLGWKRLLAAAVCLHWFNPLVWAMYLCANRDLELACDEAVVRILGLDSRKGYALALLAAAEEKSFPLFTTYKTRNHIEERIRAIMKIDKNSLAATIAAVLLVAGVTTAFATSSTPASKNSIALPQTEQNVQTAPAPAQTSNTSHHHDCSPDCAGTQHHAETYHDNSQQTSPAVAPVAFVSGMGCSDPNCTDASHHHDCPADCTDYNHHHSCPLDCTDAQHHHAETHHDNSAESHHAASRQTSPAAEPAAPAPEENRWDLPAGPIQSAPLTCVPPLEGRLYRGKQEYGY